MLLDAGLTGPSCGVLQLDVISQNSHVGRVHSVTLMDQDTIKTTSKCCLNNDTDKNTVQTLSPKSLTSPIPADRSAAALLIIA